MKSLMLKIALGMSLAGVLPVSGALAAEEGVKTLPTLLIKGEVVSIDTSDPAANLLKVKDRYGFETPIFLTSETKITQGESTVEVAALSVGTPVEVEYNFDINTAKRHAVSVKVAAPTQAASSSAPAATPAMAAPAGMSPAAPASAEPIAAPAAPAEPASPAPAEEAAPQEDTAPATQ